MKKLVVFAFLFFAAFQISLAQKPTQWRGENSSGVYQVDNMLFEKLILHPNYTGFHGKGSNSKMSLQHDVMLVKLYGFSDQPTVKLHDPSKSDKRYDMRQPTDGEEFVVTGWGDTNPQAGK